MHIEEFVTRLKGVKRSGDGYIALCPCKGHNDTQQSLSVNPGDDGKILVSCHRGCKTEDIMADLNLKMADLFPNNKKSSFNIPTKGLSLAALAADKGFQKDFLNSLGVVQEKNYVKITYLLEDGTQAPRQRIRKALRAKDGSRWAKGEGSPVPYGLWKITEAQDAGYIILVEGESDCWTLWYHNFPALGIPGADMTKKIKFEHIKDIQKIYVMREPDKGGDIFAAGVAERLASWKSWNGEAFEIRLSELTGAKDPNDLHKRNPGEFKQVFQVALDNAEPLKIKPPLEKPEREEKDDSKSLILFTDMENARRLVEFHGKDIKYNHLWGKWLIWDGQRWAKDDTGGIIRRAKNAVNRICAEHATDKKTLKYALRLKNKSKIEAMIKLAESEPEIYITPEALDSDPMLLNVNNGMINLRTGELKPHDRRNLITKLAPVDYDPEAKAPIWDAFLNRIMDGNSNLINFLQRATGYSMTADISEQVLLIPYGGGGNGKSVFLNIILDLMGDYARPAAPDLLMVKRGEAHPTEVADLEGARLVTCIETEEGKRLAEATVKQLTGGDKLKARFMRQDFFEFNPTHKLWLAVNHRPVVKGSDHGIWRRIRLIPFSVTIPKEEQDKQLFSKLKKELPGILNWAIQGCLMWQHEGLGVPEEVTQATETYRAEMDIIGDFINDCCRVNPLAKVLIGYLYNDYVKWCQENGEFALSQRKLGQRLAERGFIRDKGTKGKWYWLGIGLLEKDDRVTQVAEGGVILELPAQNENKTPLGGVLGGGKNNNSGVMQKTAPTNTTNATPQEENDNNYELDFTEFGGVKAW